MRISLLRHFVARLAILLGVVFLGGTLALVLPAWTSEKQEEKQEQSEQEAAPVEPLLEVTRARASVARRRVTTRAEIAVPAARRFALDRKRPPSPPNTRGPDSLSAPIPCLLN